MKYIKTTMGTGWEKRSKLSAIIGRLIEANPNYVETMHQIAYWLIEIDDDDIPWRELGIDENHIPVLAGPTESDYGYWHDTNMRYQDFDCDAIAAKDFESKWLQFWNQNSNKKLIPLE